jgi:hypothetical protein
MSKITGYGELAEPPAVGDMHLVVDVSDTTQAATGTTKKVSHKNVLGYTEYVALLSQSGTDAPTAVVVKNDTGATVSFAYLGVGAYSATFSSAVLTANKTIVILGETIASHKGAIVSSTSLVILSVSNPTGVNANTLLGLTPLIVRIYV